MLYRNKEEQNLVAFQHKQHIYYRAHKNIKKGMELLVEYADQETKLGTTFFFNLLHNYLSILKKFFHLCLVLAKVYVYNSLVF